MSARLIFRECLTLILLAASTAPGAQTAADTATTDAARSAADTTAQHSEVTPEPEGYWTGPLNAPAPASLTDGKIIRSPEFLTLLKRGTVVSVDVSSIPQRPEGLPASEPWKPSPQQVIPGSLWIPGAGVGTIQPAVQTLFRKRLAMATSQNPTYPIVIYSSVHPWLGWNAAKRAIRYGYRNVYWYPEGTEGWRAAGHSTVVAKPLEP